MATTLHKGRAVKLVVALLLIAGAPSVEQALRPAALHKQKAAEVSLRRFAFLR
jgi:hypothetical protein